ncbi:hypothetical protein M9H77_12237 [Catharanthus roseus]|uniref:Uncharacterized protein n=1 Tax=Catharanthus roseus TaxID=4058 RepID=A0ACC0BH08_CATRO|nr:hypothetical protein M9H77_12237 [Catharanthus roseus]
MDHSLMAKFQSFLLCYYEKVSINMAETDFTAGMVEYNLCCVRCFIWGKLMNAKNYRSVICQVWGCLDLNVIKFQERVYELFCPKEDSRKKALDREPWCIDNYLFIIKLWDPAKEARL